MSGKALVLCTVLAVLLVEAPAEAETFKSADFLKWSRENQEFYIRTSVGMAGLIAVQNDKQHSQCIEDWYFSNEESANRSILVAMTRFPNYHPRGVILAKLQKVCGSFTYKAK